MTVDRITRLNALMKQEIGEALYRHVPQDELDLGAVTVTRVVVSRSLQHARVMISIRGHETERRAMLDVLWQHRQVIQEQINHDLHLKYTPRLIFELDPSLEKGDHVLSVLAELEREHPEDAPQPPGQEETPDATDPATPR